ncbi:uncharacterized protein LOC141784572 [Halichoeres trimaculatus]|uniref:uncharacterized protein LOC141784572 n=1 Tax=Halichoeres trimaculatus TaxID=147232 RepID=UPI003D9ECD10
MKFLLSSLLLASFCALSSWSVSSGIPVLTQAPHVSARVGENVTITCCWTGELERGTINWWKNQTRVKSDIFIYDVTKESLQKTTSSCSDLNFPKVTKADSGRYTCELSVEIPSLAQVNGSGTVLTVKDREHMNNTHDNSDDSGNQTEDVHSSSGSYPIIISLGVVAPLLLISLLCFCTLRRKQAKAARVIYEVPHTDSEMSETDKHSTTSSRGSSQWCQVPVYESFYFERVQDKESE